MQDMQKMFDGSLTPIAPHVSDVVVCSDGSECPRLEAFVDCVNEYHRTEEERHEADVAIVSDMLDGEYKWCEEYCTENTDYADGYFGCVSEGSHNWDGPVKEWIRDNWDDITGDADLADCIEGELTAMVCNELSANFDCEPEFCRSEYSAYSGDGCCLDGFAIGEYETQVDINGHPALQVLHDAGRLDIILDDVNCDLYVSRSRRREKVKCRNCDEPIGSAHRAGCKLNADNGSDVSEDDCNYENVGRETYMPYERDSKHPNFLGSANISGRWDFVVSAERMEELLCEAIVEWAGYDD